MRRDDQALLTDILESAREAVDYAANMAATALEEDRMRLLAIVRLLEVIGEAASGISEPFRQQHPELPWRQMIATRNRLIHGYADVDPAVVARIAQGNLPAVVMALEGILE